MELVCNTLVKNVFIDKQTRQIPYLEFHTIANSWIYEIPFHFIWSHEMGININKRLKSFPSSHVVNGALLPTTAHWHSAYSTSELISRISHPLFRYHTPFFLTVRCSKWYLFRIVSARKRYVLPLTHSVSFVCWFYYAARGSGEKKLWFATRVRRRTETKK